MKTANSRRPNGAKNADPDRLTSRYTVARSGDRFLPQHLLIVYHTQSGTTSRMAEAVIRGAGHEDIDGVEVRVSSALDADAEDLLWCDGFILGTPENFGYMSGAMKYFLDRVYYPCEGKINGKPFALFIRAGNDGTGAINSLRRILTGLAVREVQEPVLIAGEFDESRLNECEELGMTMAAGLEAGVF
ncbi:MAG: flavodoxin family protein [Gammaproteobacteria bacterium]|nr:flavodoxin family protein [Gammaproteobacteria bacterium]